MTSLDKGRPIGPTWATLAGTFPVDVQAQGLKKEMMVLPLRPGSEGFDWPSYDNFSMWHLDNLGLFIA